MVFRHYWVVCTGVDYFFLFEPILLEEFLPGARSLEVVGHVHFSGGLFAVVQDAVVEVVEEEVHLSLVFG